MSGDLTNEVKAFAEAEGASLVGVASVDRFQGAPSGHHPTDLLRRAQSVVVIAYRFPLGLLAGSRIPAESELVDDADYFKLREHVFSPGGAGFFYPTANWELQSIAIRTALFLEDQGHLSIPVPASGTRVQERYVLFSHRHAAVLAGLGEFGLNNLLLTPKYGPRVRLCSIITTAELRPDPMLTEPVCLGEDKCGLCLKQSECFGEIHEFELGGKVMRMARFGGVCAQPCNRDQSAFFRFCYGICPIGKADSDTRV
jgi:epoxyqueuosine reductase QueG